MRRVFILPLLFFTAFAKAQVTIDNIEAGADVRYPVVALRGTAAGDTVAVGADWSSAIKFPVINGKWAGFAQLRPGENMLKALSGKTTLKFLLDYKPQTNPLKVTTLYVLGSDSEEKFYSTQRNEKFPIREKMDIMMKLLQSANAEAMNAAGYGRKTFNLEFDANGKVVVHYIRLPKTAAEMRGLDNNASWGYIYDQVKTQYPEDNHHWAGLLGFTTYDSSTAKQSGAYALGGGSQAMFGSGTLQWMPSTWADVPLKMADATIIDSPAVLEDSAGRGTVWANVSTGYGALLHEIGHTFGLPHSADGFSVMSRGFDNFSRWFTAEDPQSKRSPAVAFGKDQMMKWDPFFAFELNASPYFQPDGVTGKPAGESKITVTDDTVLLDAPDGIIGWAAMRDDLPHVWKALPDAPHQVKLSIKDLRAQLKTEQEFTIVSVDKFGRQSSVQVK